MERAFAAAVDGAAELVVRAWYEGWFGFIWFERAFAAAVDGEWGPLRPILLA